MKEKVVDLAVSNGELIFDSLLENGLLKDIPLLGNAVKVLQLKGDVTNYLFAKKLEAFLVKLKNSHIDEIDVGIENRKQLQKISSDLVFILERVSNVDKSKWIAQAVIGLVERRYCLDTFERRVYTIERFSPTLKSTLDVWYLPIDYSNGKGYAFAFDGDHPEELANLGLLRRKYEAKVTNDDKIPVTFEACNLGQQLWYVIENA
ncbi:hypothetical protein [Vibrio alginolyticus]|uniref:hypothetical protein n=1 Tax=Vibrio alginolyticus TaxID=663 RepID=UPI0028FC31BF|nr:hypothetical protein [Vibrio alginolyticus]WNW05033.1 hypothetical protein RO483_08630 [Vibrio alginolyticus]